MAVGVKKRLIVCCDGTWMNSAYGYVKPGLLGGRGGLQVPSNVTRISRCFKRRCSDGTLQIIYYESGVGSGSNVLDSITGGAFGVGLAERVREAYAFLCANYRDGDDMLLVGFSRGAFTARSVAGLLANLGLLTREGVEHFYPIFKDMQNWHNDDYRDPFPSLPFPEKPRGRDAAAVYRERLVKMGYTRVHQHDGALITVKAICVWDTWHDTALSDRIEHAFQALALDETRAPFSPALWERPRHATTVLKQVWFPGNHSNCGGGWDDQGIANCTLAWMMDQMASVGVEFDIESLDRVIQRSRDHYINTVVKHGRRRRRREKLRKWAVDAIYNANRPVRPWGLGAIQRDASLLFKLFGSMTRTPGVYKQVDPKTRLDMSEFLRDTNETVHSSVRARLACGGLGLNDESVWTCPALSSWRLKQVRFMPSTAKAEVKYHDDDDEDDEEMETRWIWKYVGDERDAPADPSQRTMREEPLGPYEAYLLQKCGGRPNVMTFAERRAGWGGARRRIPGFPGVMMAEGGC
ncbi:hypothetical protein CP532_3858 [Ophiocordyceps camponoti-leonardi (nom. inval.)]|nr:hypothetical protein CP532_3858 [Ophiocordyceps camponoti-leonardi (nom. inval.)]